MTALTDRFTAGRDSMLGYQALAEIFSARNVPAAKVLDATVGWMHELAGQEARNVLSSGALIVG